MYGAHIALLLRMVGDADKTSERQENKLKELLDNLQSLKGLSGGAFERKYKELFGIDFPYNAMDAAAKTKAKLSQGIAIAGVIDALDKLQATAYTMRLTDSDAPDVLGSGKNAVVEQMRDWNNNSFKQKAIALFKSLVGDEGVNKGYAEAFVNSAYANSSSNAEARQKILEKANALKKNLEASLNNLTNGKGVGFLFQQYSTAYGSVVGSAYQDAAAKLVGAYVQSEAFLDMGATIGLTIATMGSGAIANAGRFCVVNLGPKLGAYAMKSISVALSAGISSSLAIVDDSVSKRGITSATFDVATEKGNNGIIYGALGAFVSGPAGEAIGKYLGKVVGVATETSLDVLFDRILTPEMGFAESIMQNGGMNYAMMFLGSRAAKMSKKQVEVYNKQVEIQLKGFTIENVDGKFCLKEKGGNIILKDLKAEDVPAAIAKKMEEIAAPEITSQKARNLHNKKKIEFGLNEKNIKVENSKTTLEADNASNASSAKPKISELLKEQSGIILNNDNLDLVRRLKNRNYTPGALKNEYTKISTLVNKVDAVLSKYVNATNFEERFSQGEKILSEIRSSSLSNEEKYVWETVLATKLLPKTDTHFHTKGAMSKECLLQLMKKHGASETEIQTTLKVFDDGAKGFKDLSAFCSAYGDISRWVKDADDMALMTYDNVMQAAKNNIGYLELRNATVGVRGMTPNEVLDAMIKGINKAKSELGNDAPTVTITVGAYRGIHPKTEFKPWDFGNITKELETKLGEKTVNQAMKHADGKNVYIEDVIEDLILKLDDADPIKAKLLNDFDNVINKTESTGKIFRDLEPIMGKSLIDEYLTSYDTPIKALYAIAKDYPELNKQFNIETRTTMVYNNAVEITRRELEETMQFVVENAGKEEYDGILTGVDLNGPESHSSAGDWKNEYKLITEYNKAHPDRPIGITVHAGETFDSSSLVTKNGIATDSNPIYSIESLQAAIEDCGAKRIGHGLQLAEFPEFIEWLRTEHPEVTVEVNATCNIMSIPAGCEGMDIHPVDQLANNGISTVICSDDPAICATNTSLESAKLALMNYNIAGNVRGIEGVAKASIEGVRTGFVPDKQKEATIKRFQQQIDKVKNLFK